MPTMDISVHGLQDHVGHAYLQYHDATYTVSHVQYTFIKYPT